MKDTLLITIDSLRVDHLGCYGYDRETSPNIDQLAESAHVFSNAFSHAGVTRVSFPTILTSSYPHMYGGYEQISERRTLISELLADEGYQTAGFHSNLYLSDEFGYARGFDTFYDSKSDPTTTARLRQAVKQHLDQDGMLFRFLKKAFNQTEKTVGVEIGSAYVGASEITDRAISTLNSMDDDEPVFIWIHYMDVHHPYIPTETFQTHFRDSPVSEHRAIQLRRKMLESPSDVTETERQTLIDLYDAEIRYTDREIGRLLSAMEDKRKGDPVVIVTADHGEEFGDHGGFSHNTVHNEGIHIPLVVADGSDGGRYEDLVGLLDLGPTIADYANAKKPDTFYGHSLKKLFDRGDWPRTKIIGEWGPSEQGERRFFVRSHDWKYMRWHDGSEELYDLQSDPEERENVTEDNPQTLEEMRETIDAHIELVDSTDETLADIEIDRRTKERLEMLGYKE